MKYEWIWFDADETLFHFDAFKGMQLMFARKGVDFTQEDFQEYQRTLIEPLTRILTVLNPMLFTRLNV